MLSTQKGDESLDNHQAVFISYSSADEGWVTKHLLSRLEEKNLKYIDKYQFRGGFPLLDEIERSMKQCLRTILVISPQYLKDSWSHYCAGLVVSYGINSEQWLAIPVIAVPCPALPEHISSLVCIDLSSEGSQDWNQLFDAVLTPPKQPLVEDFADLRHFGPPSIAGPRAIGKGLEALRDLMDRDEVRAEVTQFRDLFETACSQIEVLADYKDIHDELHAAQKECLQPLLDARRGFPDEEGACANVLNCQYDLERNLESIREILERPTFVRGLHLWPKNLEIAHASLVLANKMVEDSEKTADREGRIEALGEAILNLNLVIAKQPTRFNDFLTEAARVLDLVELIQALTSIGGHLMDLKQEREKVKRFEAAIENLADLYRKLKVLLSDHDKWQEIDLMLREMRNNPDISRLKSFWKFLPEIVEQMYVGRPDPWALQFQSIGQSLGEAILAGDFERAKGPFQVYYSMASDRFVRVDKAIKGLCTNLREVGGALSLVLEMIQ